MFLSGFGLGILVGICIMLLILRMAASSFVKTFFKLNW